MSPLLRKEIRLLLPSFSIAMLLTFSIWLIPANRASASGLSLLLIVFPFLLCPVMLVMTALDSFGREVSSGTFSNLLAQPIPRQHIWRTKIVLLAAALGIISGSWWLSYFLHVPSAFMNGELHEVIVITILFALAIFAGGQWTVLLFRQVAAAFWFTLIVPFALLLTVVSLTEKHRESTEPILIAVFAIYTVVGVFLSRRLFLRAQDFQWTGGNIAMPGWLKLPRLFTFGMKAPGRRPRLALLAKELQLHQSLFVIAGVLALLHLALIAARQAFGGFKDSPALAFFAFQFWALWLLMPLLIGCAPVAEERKLGTLEAQLSLPARRRTQFIIKLGVAATLAIFFGAMVPVLFEGSRILPDIQASPENFRLLRFGIAVPFVSEVLHIVHVLMPYLPLSVLALTIAGIAFYASTLARNTLHSIGPAILGIIITGVLLGTAVQIEHLSQYPLWRGSLIYLIGVPVMSAVLVGLAYWNFKRVFVGWPVWRRNGFVLFASLALVGALTAAIYHRSWEFFTPLEPKHGPERISRTTAPTLRDEGVSATTAVFPDGRVWHNRLIWAETPISQTVPWETSSQFLEGTNWISATAASHVETVGIKSDGTLWLAELPQANIAWTNNKPYTVEDKPATLARVGNDSDWRRVIREGWKPSVLLLKTDGSLWRWGEDRTGLRSKQHKLPAFDSQRLGAESDWTDMIRVGGSIYLWKTGGSAWAINPFFQGPKKDRIELAPGLMIERYRYLDHMRFRTMAQGQPFQVGVRHDGQLLGWGTSAWVFKDPNVSIGQIGNETNWLAVAASDAYAVALKTDGSLWRWDLGWRLHRDARPVTPTQVGSKRDWVAVSGCWNGVLSLAADGSLWFWQLDSRHSSSLLRPSRRPQLIGNIFGSTAHAD